MAFVINVYDLLKINFFFINGYVLGVWYLFFGLSAIDNEGDMNKWAL